jgi:hypothetical protein
MKTFEVEKDKNVYLVIEAFHYLRDGIGSVDLLALDYSDKLRLKMLTATECRFLGFRDDIDEERVKELKTPKKSIVEHTTLADQMKDTEE